MDAIEIVIGHRTQKDWSGGQGHCWELVEEDDIPADVAEELACAIIEEDPDRDDYIACNGQHYRWQE